MQVGPFQGVRIARGLPVRLTEVDAAILILDALGVLVGQVEEGAKLRGHVLVQAALDRLPRGGESERVGGEGVRRAAVEVAGELVEQDQQRQRSRG